MSLPPRGDPQRPLRLAIRSMRSLGIIFLLLGGCATIPLYIRSAPGPGGARVGMLRDIGSLLFYFGPAVIYLICSIFLQRRRFWALIVTMAVAGVQILFLAVGLAVISYFTLMQMGWFMLIPMGIMLVLLLALAQLEYHLARSFKLIRQPLLDEQRGFEPLHITPAMLEPSMTEPPLPWPSNDPSRGGPNVPSA